MSICRGQLGQHRINHTAGSCLGGGGRRSRRSRPRPCGTHHQTQVILRQVDHGRIEIGPLLEGICGHADGERRRSLRHTKVSGKAPGARELLEAPSISEWCG